MPTFYSVFVLTGQVESAAWNDKSDVLLAIADARLVTWYYPNAVAIDRDLLELASTSRDVAEFGKVDPTGVSSLPEIIVFQILFACPLFSVDNPLLTSKSLCKKALAIPRYCNKQYHGAPPIRGRKRPDQETVPPALIIARVLGSLLESCPFLARR